MVTYSFWRTSRIAVLACTLLLVSNVATWAQPYGYSDAWSDEYYEVEGTDTGRFYGFGLTEVEYGNYAGVVTEVLDPNGWTMVSDWTVNHWWTNIDVEYNVPENGTEGDYNVQSTHYKYDVGNPGLGWVVIAVSNIFVNVNNYYTRYYFNESIGRYYAWFCGNACQRNNQWMPFPGGLTPPYVQGIGKRIRILWYNYCRIGLFARESSEGLQCWPPS